MIKRKHLYDFEILKVAYQHLNRPRGQPDADGQVLALSLGSLRPDDVVHRDIVDDDNRLLLAAGAQLSEITIRRLRALNKGKRAIDVVEIVRK